MLPNIPTPHLALPCLYKHFQQIKACNKCHKGKQAGPITCGAGVVVAMVVVVVVASSAYIGNANLQACSRALALQCIRRYSCSLHSKLSHKSEHGLSRSALIPCHGAGTV